MTKAMDLVGKRFGKLSVVERLENNSKGNTMWLCKCDCGNMKEALGYDLTHGRTISCGCSRHNHEKRPDKRIDIAGKRYGNLAVIKLDEEKSRNGILVWECACDCGSRVFVRGGNLKSGHTKSCGCRIFSKTTEKDLSGKKFGRLTVIEKYGKIDGKIAYRCICECGKEKIAIGTYLTSGRTKSCGCLDMESRKNPKRVTHGLSKTRIYREYRGMLSRCSPNYHNSSVYYERGISVCEEWLGEYGFEKFYDWSIQNGYQDDLTLDRKDNNKGYSAGNCRWVTMKTQQNNRSDNVFIEYMGEKKTLKQWCEYLGLNYGMVKARRRNGWEVPRLFEPPNNKNSIESG